MTHSSRLLVINELTLSFENASEQVCAVKNVSLGVAQGEIVALIGESGSGKTLVAKTVLQLQPNNCKATSGAIEFDGVSLLSLSPKSMESIRGCEIGFILQEPMVSLNPSLSIGKQMTEALIFHKGFDKSTAIKKAIAMLETVGVNQPEKRLAQYPHEFSGGMRQRIMIAAVMLLEPKLVIADEPTTALDASIQAEVMNLLLALTKKINAAVLLITHDLSVVADYADQIVVLEKGNVVEKGNTQQIFEQPSHPYTIKLLKSLPTYKRKHNKQFIGAPVAKVDNLEVSFVTPSFFPWQQDEVFHAVKGVSLAVHLGEVVALVGESGSGKSTIGRTLVGLQQATSGNIYLQDHCLATQLKHNAFPDIVQLIFQDPYSSLNPRFSIKEILFEGIIDQSLSEKERITIATEMLADVDLDSDILERYPHQLSGGQRQRICIARALISNPKLVVADEPVAALDLTVQARVLDLLKRLQTERQFSMLFISHDLAVVQQFADTVYVMQSGRIIEKGPTCDIFENPHHPYTLELLKASPYLDKTTESGGYKLTKRYVEQPSLPNGMAFYSESEHVAENAFFNLDPFHSVLVSYQERRS